MHMRGGNWQFNPRECLPVM
ncbi:hypothetical protein CCACVL1_07991 [Corchorus capsularis]|uniref:Uncharacterized protein n=1 Tax=Corchorus capsularis TaxID=210143 RepID=A0A1R3J2X1_COCAP|nr:hypothetical protein CCACVL1_07991 [Corchorus capsularis]